MQIALQKFRLLTFHVLFPLSFGVLIYLFFRGKSIIIFRWFDIFEINSLLESSRNYLFQYSSHLPAWLIYSLPDALWVYALISSLFIVWGKDFLNLKFWLIVSLLLAPLLEFLQFIKFFPGTFDFVDLLFYLIGSILSLTIVKHNLKKNEKQNY
jgi:hypothetical protein